jgi:uncharacterized protein YyaL (SSP411 family)
MHKFNNALSGSSSPYLLQHAHNPVNWIPWSEEVFKLASAQNKLVLISIGYSSCHWCHVMEKECFEDEEVAELMNNHFINVKVDREEYPDVDQIYMTAVQLMTQKGGWPLNCFTLPDGRPIYGGTYFPKEQWMHILRSLEHTFRNDRPKTEEYATRLSEGIRLSDLIQEPAKGFDLEEERLHEMVLRWSRNFDSIEGGGTRAPKFPMPNNYEFLLRYGVRYDNDKVLSYVELTLDKMASGGLYDQIGGGFYRYSVDMIWKVPHFEKMLYDNAQLIQLYAQAYQVFQKEEYRQVVDQTVAWLNREMFHKEGAYFSALDADSEGEEGKFYCWDLSELKRILGEDLEWVRDYYSINQKGYWEEGKFIFMRSIKDQEFAQKRGWSLNELTERVNRVKEILLSERKSRVRPGLDYKCITSWNAMLVGGLCMSYRAFENEEYKILAGRIMRWIEKFQFSDGQLFRIRTNEETQIQGVLEDYATVIKACIDYFEISGEDKWISFAEELQVIVLNKFNEERSSMFYFSSVDANLIVRKMEINDNVIPSSNSIMARNMFRMGQLFQNRSWVESSKQMLMNIYDGMEQYGSGYSNWGLCLMDHVNPYYQIVVQEDTENRVSNELLKHYLPNSIMAVTNKSSNQLPIFEHKATSDLPSISVCYEGMCLLPTQDVQEAIMLMSERD